MSSAGAREFVDTIRMTRADRELLLGDLDRTTRRPNSDSGRRHDRFAYRGIDVRVTVDHPGTTTGQYLVVPRNLSESGMSFLHGGFLYTGSPCELVLCSLDGKELTTRGVIVRCALVKGRVHEIGVKFDEPIEIGLFVHASASLARQMIDGETPPCAPAAPTAQRAAGKRLGTLAMMLAAAVHDGDLPHVKQIAALIQTTATGFGDASLIEACRKAVPAIADAGTITELRAVARALATLCMQRDKPDQGEPAASAA